MPAPPRPRATHRHRPITLATILGTLSLLPPILSMARLYASNGSLLPFLYTFFLSGVTFLIYGYDKMQARNLRWRVSEKTLFLLGVLGGWPGALVGMHYFQHKTRKRGFLVGVWASVVGWEVVWWWGLVN